MNRLAGVDRALGVLLLVASCICWVRTDYGDRIHSLGRAQPDGSSEYW